MTNRPRSHPAAVLVDGDLWEALLERLDDAEDRLAVHEATGDTISLDDVERELDHRTHPDGGV